MARLEFRKAAFAAASGILTALAMPGFGLGPLVLVSLVPLFFALEGKRRFAYGILFGATFIALDLRWVLTLYRFTPLVVPGFALLVLYVSLFFGVFALLVTPPQPRRLGAVLFLGAPAVFTLLEVARAQGPLGNGFSALFMALYRTPSLIQAAAAFGPWSLTAFIVFVNVAVYLAVRRRRLVYAAAAVAGVVALAVFSLVPIAPDAGEPLRAAAVSSTVAQEEKLNAANLADLAERYLNLGRLALEGNPDLVVFPESILPAFITRDDELFARLSELATAGDARLLIGTGDYRDGDLYNTAALILPDGTLSGVYAMVRPVPFGEYVPGRRLWEAIGLGRFVDSFLPVDLTPGDAFTPLDGIGTPICFESTFPDPSRRFVGNGADILVIITNDAWFVSSSELKAHFASAIFRAVETRRYVVQAANGGISGLIDPRGKILAETVHEEIIAGTVYARYERTFYARWGDLPLLLALGAAGMIFFALRFGHHRAKRNGE
jgi:apolipoprotein N-acyltransferase